MVINTLTADWKIYKSGYYSNTIKIVDGNDKPVNITGYKFYFTVKTNIDDADAGAIHQENWTSHTAPTEGTTSFEFNVSETNALTAGDYIYDISFITNHSPARKFIPFTGNLIIQVPVTKAIT